jgi:hypothetical protein
VRSGAVAFGKEANGHSRHTGVPLTSVRSADEGAGRWLTDGTVSRPQMKAQAAQSHRKVSGSSVAVILRRVKRLTGIRRIIRGRVDKSTRAKTKAVAKKVSAESRGRSLQILEIVDLIK